MMHQKELLIYLQPSPALRYLHSPDELTAHEAIGVTHESQSRGVSRLLLHTAPLLFTHTSHELGSAPGYDEAAHSNSVMWCTIELWVALHREGGPDRHTKRIFNHERRLL